MQNMMRLDISLCVDSDIIQCSDVLHDLSVMLDCELTIKQHLNKVAQACFYQILKVPLPGPTITASFVSAFVLSRLDYCNAVLGVLPKSTIAPL